MQKGWQDIIPSALLIKERMERNAYSWHQRYNNTTSDKKKVVFHEFHCTGQKSSFFELCKSSWGLTWQRAKIRVSCTSKRKILTTRSLSVSRRAKMRKWLLHLVLGVLRASDWSPKSQSNSYYIKRKEVHEKDRCTSIVSGCYCWF